MNARSLQGCTSRRQAHSFCQGWNEARPTIVAGPTEARGAVRPQRRRYLRIAGEVAAVTPLVLPAFSSQVRHGETLGSTLDELLRAVLGPVLVSAFDLVYGDVPNLDRRIAGSQIPFAVVDSGGYECISLHKSGSQMPEAWSRRAHRDILERWPNDRRVVAVSYDDPREGLVSVAHQVERANSLFAGLGHLGRCMLLRSPCDRHLLIDDVVPHLSKLAGFDVIGITEKDAGASHLDRLRLIRGLRSSLDGVGVEVPLHVFGSLDPFLAPSYFLAGADVFDGLSWIRHRFRDGLLVEGQCHDAFVHPETDFGVARWDARRANLRAIGDLQVAMQRVAEGADIDEFGPLAARLIEIHTLAFPDDR